MVNPLLAFRALVFGIFILCNTVLCSVGAWNLSFAREDKDSRTAPVDAFLIFTGAFGITVFFPIIFTEVVRRGALTSRVWFEASWLTLFWLLNFAGAVAVSCMAPNEFCRHSSSGSGNDDSSSGCSSAKVLIVFAWLNTVFLFTYFVILIVSAIIHQQEDTSVWQSSTIDVPWFATKQCIRSAPNSPSASFSRFMRTKPPSLVCPKPRRANLPAPIFVQGRAGLSSRIEIEHFNVDGSVLEAQPISPEFFSNSNSPPPLPPAAAAYASVRPGMYQTNSNPVACYPQHVQRAYQVGSSAYYDNSYYPSHSRNASSSPPPLGDNPLANSKREKKRERRVEGRQQRRGTGMEETPIQVSERAIGKRRATTTHPPSRQGSNASTTSPSPASSKSHRPSPPPPLRIDDLSYGARAGSSSSLPRAGGSARASPLHTPTPTYAPVPGSTLAFPEQSPTNSPSRSRPGGPRTRTRTTSSNSRTRPRPPPLDLTINGSTPNVRR